MTSASICIEQPGALGKGTAWPFPLLSRHLSGFELSLHRVVLSTLELVPKGPSNTRTQGMEGDLAPDSLLQLLPELQREARSTKTLEAGPCPRTDLGLEGVKQGWCF